MNINQRRADIILHRLGMNGITLQRRLADIQESVLRDKEQLIAAHPVWDLRDARIRSLYRLFGILGGAGLGIHFLGKLLDDDWWQENERTSMPQDAKDAYTVNLEMSVKYGFGMGFFTSLEASFRTFLRAIDPEVCKKSTAPFKNIYQCLLGAKQLGFSPADRKAAENLLNFVRLIRNLIHNNGVYFDEEDEDKREAYDGAEYHFRHGKPVDFVSWELLLKLADDIRQLLVQVISHKKIATIDQIEDLFVAYNW